MQRFVLIFVIAAAFLASARARDLGGRPEQYVLDAEGERERADIQVLEPPADQQFESLTYTFL